MNNEQNINAYMDMETAAKYKKTASDAASQMSPEQRKTHLQQPKDKGYIIFPNVLSKQTLAEVKEAAAPLLAETGRNYFEGELTQRIYSVIAKTFACNP
jgi:hypothetical protein